MMSKMQLNFYTIPAGLSFTRTLAENLLEETSGTPETLSQIQILLPTRRACRMLRESFLDLTGGQPLLLPRMQPLGDVDEEELSLTLLTSDDTGHILNLPPAIAPVRRQLLLAKTIMALPDFTQGTEHALSLAQALSLLMDQVYTENLSLQNLDTLVPEDFADHWQITVDFLKILSQRWPEILAEEGVIDAADRRNRLMLALADSWEATQPETRIIGAGSTGSIPATARLLDVIAHLPQGAVILPGFDLDIDAQSWEALEETHPQYGFKHLLGTLNIERERVKPWIPDTPQPASNRHVLAREIMRPAAQTQAWMSLGQSDTAKALRGAIDTLSLFECEHAGEEALVIALKMREVLETPGQTAALITPDRNLARRVMTSCRRWGITLDDSAGKSLDQTPLGIFLLLSLKAVAGQLGPVDLLGVLKHPLCTILDTTHIAALDQHVLRGPKPSPGLEGLKRRLEHTMLQDSEQIYTALESAFRSLLSLSHGQQSFQRFLKVHLDCVDALSGAQNIWACDEGADISQLLSTLHDQNDLLDDMTLQDYSEILQQFLKNQTIRPSYGTHPRLHILGQLEARLINADVVILGGLNEGTWPAEPAHDPWMSRPMRKSFGLPVAERSIGLAAHDFVQGLCSGHVVMTRSRRQDGAPTVPARWLERLKTVMQALDMPFETLQRHPHLAWARTLDKQDHITPQRRPAPTPPVEKRPATLPATKIETWMKDPYSIYAYYILKLKPLEPLEQDMEAAARGILLHDVLDRFIKAHPKDVPENAAAILHDYAQQSAQEIHDDDSVWRFWWPRFERLSAWFIGQEHIWRLSARPHATEISGQTTINGQNQAQSLTITARADRIDAAQSGAAIIDYKSAGSYSKSKIIAGALPQLGVEALICAKSGFENIAPALSSISYWTMTGGKDPGIVTEIKDGLDTLIDKTEKGLQHFVDAFAQQETPYYSLPRPDQAPRYNDYEHLARVKEWAALDDANNATSSEAA